MLMPSAAATISSPNSPMSIRKSAEQALNLHDAPNGKVKLKPSIGAKAILRKP